MYFYIFTYKQFVHYCNKYNAFPVNQKTFINISNQLDNCVNKPKHIMDIRKGTSFCCFTIYYIAYIDNNDQFRVSII